MDPTILTVVLGVISNGLWSLLCVAGHGGLGTVGKRKSGGQEALLGLLTSAMPSDVTIEWDGPPTDKQAIDFLQRPEVEEIIRHVFSVKILEPSDAASLEKARLEFAAALALNCGVLEDQIPNGAQHLFNAIITACERMLDLAVEDGSVLAHDIKSSLRHRILQDEIATLGRSVAMLTGTPRVDIEAIDQFAAKYRSQVAGRHGYITPPYYEAARKVPINDLYVMPQVVPFAKDKEPASHVMGREEYLPLIYHTVLLGNPGGGKSTFAAKLCYDVGTESATPVIAGRRLLAPILVTLRDYGAEKKRSNCSIVQFIEMKSQADYQLPAPAGAVEYLLLTGRAMVIFDGLDELLETHHRQEVSSDVESFCDLYPSAAVLVTSREVGYEQAPLDPRRFDVYKLAPFNDAQVKQYVDKWFSADHDLTPGERGRLVSSFLAESKSVPDLRSNALMLSLLCNIYRGENYIPRNRPDVYEKCANMLFERWDKSRGLRISLPFEAQVRPTMQYLAFWIYTAEQLQAGVTEVKLVEKAAEYLRKRQYDDSDEALAAAREFIAFCRGRAWVFTDTGTTKDGDRLYQFTHRTFLEYFAAGYLVRIHPTPGSLSKTLQPRIARREWDVVAELAFQSQGKSVEDASDKLLLALIVRARASDAVKRWNYLSFAARCLEFMIPAPRIVREITKTVYEFALDSATETREVRQQTSSSARANTRVDLQSVVGALLAVAADNRAVVGDVIEKLLIDAACNAAEARASVALELGLNLVSTLVREQRTPQESAVRHWEAVQARICAACQERIRKLSVNGFATCFDAYSRRVVSMSELVQWHGANGIFRTCSRRILSESDMSVASRMLMAISAGRHDTARTEDLISIVEVGRILLAIDPPWISRSTLARYASHELDFAFARFTEMQYGWQNYLNQERPDPAVPNNDLLFGVLVMFAAQFEMYEEPMRRHSTHLQFDELLLGSVAELIVVRSAHRITQSITATAENALPDLISTVVVARLSSATYLPRIRSRSSGRQDRLSRYLEMLPQPEAAISNLESSLHGLRLTAPQLRLILRWSAGQLNLVA
jgi:hypothetical protein